MSSNLEPRNDSLAGDVAQSAAPESAQYLEIDIGRRRRWTGFVGFLVFLLIVGGLLVGLFIKVTGSVVLAVVLVAFMVGYMTIMGWMASRNLSQRES